MLTDETLFAQLLRVFHRYTELTGFLLIVPPALVRLTQRAGAPLRCFEAALREICFHGLLNSLPSNDRISTVSAADIIEKIKQMPVEDWLLIQTGIGELLATSLSGTEVPEIDNALAEADEDGAAGRTSDSEEMRRHFGLR
jgi:hypothetical protein